MKSVHLMGVGGVGMAALAVLLKRRGWAVSGCDVRDSPRLAWLRAQGVVTSVGHDAAHVGSADAVVFTPAVPADHPEYVAARTRGVCRRRGAVLAELVTAAPDAVAVCGSHGKTTTATFVARLLRALGGSVEWAIGGETGSFPVAGGDAGGALVVEADESDGTLAAYRAKTLVVTNCEYDHPDHFPTRADYVACFDAARRQAGTVVEGGGVGLSVDDRAVLEPVLAPLAPHNRLNALTAADVARRRGFSAADIARALPSVVAELPDRRFQRLAEGVYTDYAHHPTEMRCALGMARRACRGRLRVLFQPHRYSRTKALLADFPAAFAEADEVVLCPTYAAFERPAEGGHIADLYAACRASAACAGVRLYLARSCAEAWEHAARSRAPGDVTLLLGAGDIIALADAVRAGTVPPARRFWIGAGSNTWKSDLNLAVAYVRTAGPADAPGASLGIPWMAGVPGTVGGWVKMNAGAFGHSVGELVEAVKVDGAWVDRAACGFGYRCSALAGEIQDVRWTGLDAVRASEPAAAYLARRPKFPSGTKGSVFRNPPGDYAGRLLEASGCKSLRAGGAYVWAAHANVAVAGPDATASDFLALTQLMRARVFHRFGVVLEYEIKGLDADGG